MAPQDHQALKAPPERRALQEHSVLVCSKLPFTIPCVRSLLLVADNNGY
jgi:hypothetical protein